MRKLLPTYIIENEHIRMQKDITNFETKAEAPFLFFI